MEQIRKGEPGDQAMLLMGFSWNDSLETGMIVCLMSKRITSFPERVVRAKMWLEVELFQEVLIKGSS